MQYIHNEIDSVTSEKDLEWVCDFTYRDRIYFSVYAGVCEFSN